ncbi:MAG: hypothetical protein GY737_05525 [Desulfobacteraceae bacterium]|nr:hypothetical protein [Desulfobacteraceae bacterium]
MKKLAYCMVFFMLFGDFVIAGTFSGNLPKQSQAASEFGFDIMETFDDIKDWQGSARNGKGPAQITSPDFPKRLDGSDTLLNLYDYWVSNDPGDNFIMDHSKNRGYIWDPNNTGTGKSLCMDISHRANFGYGDGKNWGPSRFGMMFGDGDRGSGYEEVYTFHMVRIAPNQWPTAIAPNKVGSYDKNEEYLYGSSWKYFTMGHGFIRPWVHGDGPGSGHDPEYRYAKSTYGWNTNLIHLKPHNEQPEFRLGLGSYHHMPTDGSPPRSPSEYDYRANRSWYMPTEVPVGEWIGVEIYYKLNDKDQANGEMKIWFYHSDGTEVQVFDRNDLWLRGGGHSDDKINMLFIGGNNSNTYYWGDTMEPLYYVDDFIINGSRIGPTYFNKKLNQPDSEPPPPTVITIE